MEESRLAGQTLMATVRGQRFGPWRAGPGDFEIRFSPPESGGEPVAFEIHASLRRIAFLLKSADWAAREPPRGPLK